MNREILAPASVTALVPAAKNKLWVYKYRNPAHGWSLSIATHGAPQSGSLSLGGFRIVPEARAALAGFNPDVEATELGIGMEEKVFWSRTCKVGGARGLKNISRIVGGKCVLMPSKGSRVGEPRDIEMLSWAVDCLKDFEEHSGVFLVTGQDLGHGMLSDGKTSSLQFMSDSFRGSVIADTGKPTGEGNLHLMLGALKGLGIDGAKAPIGLLGIGNIGEHLLSRLLSIKGSSLTGTVQTLEASPTKRSSIEARGVKVWAPEQRSDFLAQPFQALAFNALGGSLDAATIKQLCTNPALRFVSGCENLIMPDPSGEKTLREARKLYCHTELCGMMGYLTAVECYLCRLANEPFAIESLYEAAPRLAEVGERAAQRVLSGDFKLSFEEAAQQIEW